jgi:hypothetical protein
MLVLNQDKPDGAKRKFRFIGEPEEINSSRKHERTPVRCCLFAGQTKPRKKEKVLEAVDK